MNPLRPVQHAIRSLAIAPVRLYQRFISPMMPPTCRYAPTCSNYAIEAVRIHGIIKGTILSLWRILRCNPWSHGGVDYVPPHGQWTPEPWVPPEDWVGHHSGESAIPMGLDPASGSTQPREYGVNSTATDLR